MTANAQGLLVRFVREPLLQFLILGAALFGLYAEVGTDAAAPRDRIVVDEIALQRLADQFQGTWMRPPTRQELKGMAEDFVKEEILYREALALGLDQNDLVIRRRMRQKMEFLNSDLFAQRTPSDAELQAFLEENRERFRKPETVTFKQIYLKPSDDATADRHRADALLARLEAEPGIDAGDLGDPTLLPFALTDAAADDIINTFGKALLEPLASAPENHWSGPYPSAYGTHLVNISRRQPGGLPALAEIREAVERDWSAQYRKQANERFYRSLQTRYAVDIRWPEPNDP